MQAIIEARKPESPQWADFRISLQLRVATMQADTPGKRVYLIRLALGDGLRSPMPMAEFAALLTERTGATYDSSMISKIENEMRKVSLDDADRIASVDPRRRGREWLAWGDAQATPTLNGIDRVSHPDPDAEPSERERAEGE
jgi:hypothetical protein